MALNRKSTLRAIAGLLIGVVAVAWLLGPQTYDWYEARQMRKSLPNLSRIPEPLDLRDDSKTPGTKISEFGYEFEVPWAEIPQTRKTEYLSDYVFGGDRAVVLFNPSDRDTSVTYSLAEQQLVSALQGYSIMKAALNTTPEQMSPFLSKREATRQLTLLKMKQVFGLEGLSSAFYSFDRGDLRGFQIGDPAKDHNIELDCFDSNGLRIHFVFSSKHGSRPTLEQREINRVINTLRVAEKPTESSH